MKRITYIVFFLWGSGIFLGCSTEDLIGALEEKAGLNLFAGNCVSIAEEINTSGYPLTTYLDVFGADSVYYFRNGNKNDYAEVMGYTYNEKAMPVKEELFTPRGRLLSSRERVYWDDGITLKEITLTSYRVEEMLVYKSFFDEKGRIIRTEKGDGDIYTHEYVLDEQDRIQEEVKYLNEEVYEEIEYVYNSDSTEVEEKVIDALLGSYKLVYENTAKHRLISKYRMEKNEQGTLIQVLDSRTRDVLQDDAWVSREYYTAEGTAAAVTYKIEVGCPQGSNQ
ncbi:hypothetical protein [Algivirga pacifica]|uniref:YD repeat-containing protein n=1 Tax=Algivirga pacifica TaxID=1162670 RepID=A0ABP9DI62_9BACT